MIEQRPDLVALPLTEVWGWRQPRFTYVETKYGWGKVVAAGTHGTVTVSLFKRREDPGKQDFPEYEVIHRPPPRGGVDEHPEDPGDKKLGGEFPGYAWRIARARSWAAQQGALRW